MSTIAFESGPLRPQVARALRARLREAHLQQPFSVLDPRASAHRVASLAAELGLSATVYRGALDLRGSEIDHLWLGIDGRVVDATFPLFVGEFVDILRRFIAGDAEPEELVASASGAGVEQRVLGVFPSPLRYRGLPVWAARKRRGTG